MKKIFTALYVGALLMNVLFIYSASPAALAQTQTSASASTCSSNSTGICNPLSTSDITTLLTDLVNDAIPIGAVLAVIMYVYIGFKFVFAQGNPAKITEAWSWLLWVSVGTAILIGAKVIVTVIESTLTSAGVVQQGLLPTTTQ